jgi:hypothetical protein
MKLLIMLSFKAAEWCLISSSFDFVVQVPFPAASTTPEIHHAPVKHRNDELASQPIKVSSDLEAVKSI